MCSFPVDFDVGKLTEKLFHNHFATASSYPLSSNRSRAFVSSLLDEHRVKCDRCNQSLNELGMKSNQKTFVTGETSTFLNLQLTFFSPTRNSNKRYNLLKLKLHVLFAFDQNYFFLNFNSCPNCAGHKGGSFLKS